MSGSFTEGRSEMRINGLIVHNFKAITHLELRDLKETIVIAGPNGCGKSCVFDAIRLLKSVYGGYQPNEWQSWFGEFQININQRQGNWLLLLQDRKTPLHIAAQFQLAPTEQAFLTAHAKDLVTDQIWKEVAPELVGWRYVGATPLAGHLRAHQPKVDAAVAEALPLLLQDLAGVTHVG
jgi:hypothetical protein